MTLTLQQAKESCVWGWEQRSRSVGSCVANQCAGILLTVVPRFVAPICSKIPPDLGAGLQDGDTLLLWFDLGTILFLENPKIRQTSFCAGSLGGAPIHTHISQIRRQKPCSKISKYYTALRSQQLASRCFRCIHRLQCDCDSRARCAAAASQPPPWFWLGFSFLWCLP